MNHSNVILKSLRTSTSGDFFAEAFQHGPLNVAAIALTCLFGIYLVPSGYGMIWYERYGSDKKRILINRVFSSVCWTGIELFALVLPLDIARYIFGPLPLPVCLFQLIHKNVVNIKTLLFCDAVTTSRYLFVFYLKNPSQFKDDFWHKCINIWVVAFCFISQFAVAYLPGRQPLNYYLCVGVDPRSDGGSISDVKKNYVVTTTLLLSVAIQVSVAIRFIVHRVKLDSGFAFYHKENFNKEILSDFAIGVAFFALSFVYGYLMLTINSLDPVLINIYPNYLMIHSLHFVFPLVTCSTFSAIFYARNKQMRTVLLEELQEYFGKKVILIKG